MTSCNITLNIFIKDNQTAVIGKTILNEFEVRGFFRFRKRDRGENIATKPKLLTSTISGQKTFCSLVKKITMSESDELKGFFDIELKKGKILRGKFCH